MKDSIKAGALRCGNWVNYKGEPIQVTMIGEYGIQSKTEDCTINAKFQFDISPIPLSPDILEKCGFEYKPEYEFYDGSIGERWIIGKFIIGSAEDYWQLSWQSTMDYKKYDYAPLFIRYLHELQNQYYALRMKELEITL